MGEGHLWGGPDQPKENHIEVSPYGLHQAKDGNWISTNLDNLEYLDFLDWAKNLDNSRLS